VKSASEDNIGLRMGAICALFLLVFLALQFCGCAPAVRDTTCARVFRDELLSCVKNANTIEESRLCREEVELRWGYPHE